MHVINPTTIGETHKLNVLWVESSNWMNPILLFERWDELQRVVATGDFKDVSNNDARQRWGKCSVLDKDDNEAMCRKETSATSGWLPLNNSFSPFMKYNDKTHYLRLQRENKCLWCAVISHFSAGIELDALKTINMELSLHIRFSLWMSGHFMLKLILVLDSN